MRCCECQDVFEDQLSLQSHISVWHCGYLPYKCYTCFNAIPSKSILQATEAQMEQHITSAHDSNSNELHYIVTVDKEKRNKLLEYMRRSLEQPEVPQQNMVNPPAMEAIAVKVEIDTFDGVSDSNSVMLVPTPMRGDQISPATIRDPRPVIAATPTPLTSKPRRHNRLPRDEGEIEMMLAGLTDAAHDVEPEEAPKPKSNASSESIRLKTSLCKLCGKAHSNPRRHVYQHMDRPVLECPYCDHSIFYHAPKQMSDHVAKHHSGQEMKIIDNKWKYMEQYMVLLEQCFGTDEVVAIEKVQTESPVKRPSSAFKRRQTRSSQQPDKRMKEVSTGEPPRQEETPEGGPSSEFSMRHTRQSSRQFAKMPTPQSSPAGKKRSRRSAKQGLDGGTGVLYSPKSFTEVQILTLERLAKEVTRNPSKEMLETTAEQLGLSLETVDNYFKNL